MTDERLIVAASSPDPVLIVAAARRFEALYGDHGPHVLRLVNDLADLVEAEQENGGKWGYRKSLRPSKLHPDKELTDD